MSYVIHFLSGLFLANGIPHFIHGISGEDFHSPSLHRLLSKKIPSPLFNAIWGLLSFALSIYLLSLTSKLIIGWNIDFVVYILGFCFASIGLSIYFKKRK